jgi:hypothetical protein
MRKSSTSPRARLTLRPQMAPSPSLQECHSRSAKDAGASCVHAREFGCGRSTPTRTFFAQGATVELSRDYSLSVGKDRHHNEGDGRQGDAGHTLLRLTSLEEVPDRPYTHVAGECQESEGDEADGFALDLLGGVPTARFWSQAPDQNPARRCFHDGVESEPDQCDGSGSHSCHQTDEGLEEVPSHREVLEEQPALQRPSSGGSCLMVRSGRSGSHAIIVACTGTARGKRVSRSGPANWPLGSAVTSQKVSHHQKARSFEREGDALPCAQHPAPCRGQGRSLFRFSEEDAERQWSSLDADGSGPGPRTGHSATVTGPRPRTPFLVRLSDSME